MRGDRRAGAHQAWRAGFRRPHVHLLLRGPLGSFTANRIVAFRSCGEHWRRSLRHRHAGVEVHLAGVPHAVRLGARSAGRWIADEDSEGWLFLRHHLDHFENRDRAGCACSGRAKLGFAAEYPGRTVVMDAGGPVTGVPEPAGGPGRDLDRSRRAIPCAVWPRFGGGAAIETEIRSSETCDIRWTRTEKPREKMNVET